MPGEHKASRIDLHAHFIPDFYRDALIEAGLAKPDGMAAIPLWNENLAVSAMDHLQIQTAMLSISSPGVHFGDNAKARTLARQVNHEGARLVQAHPGRFGHFACLPLPDIEGALTELAYAFETLHADGIILETNHHGLYLGDPLLHPLYTELNRRKARIFVHPTSPACSCGARLDATYPRPMLEFMFETTRSVADLVLAGVAEHFPDLQFIIPHAGAALPVLMDRVDLMSRALPAAGKPRPSLRAALKKFHFDLAGAPVPYLLQSLLEITGIEHLHYGSDWPFTPLPACEYLAAQLATTSLLTANDREAMWHTNSSTLFPRLKPPL